jgi:DNA-binding IclR family transcriptional regulator
MAAEVSRDATSSGTVARVTLLLGVLAESDGAASLSEIAERMRLPVSTTHRLLHLLLDQGFVERGQGSRTYRAGLEFLRVAGLVTSRAEITEIAQGFMQAVVAACDETCMLSLHVPRTQSSMITKVIHGSHPLRYEAAMYQPTSLLWGATGRGILAFAPQEVIDAVLARKEPSPATGRTATAAQIRRELAHIRSRGYAHTHGQKVGGAVGMSAPVFNTSGVIGALCITLPESRFRPAMEARFARTLMEQAARFSATLGYRGGPVPGGAKSAKL